MDVSNRPLLIQRFIAALAAQDEVALRELCAEDVTWSVPGTSKIAGINVGVEGILAIQRTLREHELKVSLQQILHGRDSIVLLLHDTGSRDGRHVDVTVALLLDLRDDTISRITGHLSDMEMFSDYLA